MTTAVRPQPDRRAAPPPGQPALAPEQAAPEQAAPELDAAGREAAGQAGTAPTGGPAAQGSSTAAPDSPAVGAAAPAARAASLRARALRLAVAVRDGAHPDVVDVTGGALLFVVCLVPALRLVAPERKALLIELTAGLVLPLMVRRRAPVIAFAVSAATAFCQWRYWSASALPADLGVLVALHAVAAHAGRAWRWAAYGVGELGALLAARQMIGPQGGAPKLFLLFSGLVTTALALGLNIRSRRLRLQMLEERAQDLERRRDEQAALAVADERSRIAREMHDVVTHNLSVMVALCDGAAYAQARSPERAAHAMVQSAEVGRRALTDMRRLLGVLRADEPDARRHPQPGVPQLAQLAEQVRAAGLRVALEVQGEAEPLSAAVQLTVYRLVQESLTNTLKHAASGARARVRIDCAPERVRIEVTDDGRPAPFRPAAPAPTPTPTPAASRPGHGLAGMRERVAAYGGSFHAGPLPDGGGHGWRVTATLDLTDTAPYGPPAPATPPTVRPEVAP